MSTPRPTASFGDDPTTPRRRPEAGAGGWALIALWLALVALPLGALLALGDAPADAPPAPARAPWMPIDPPIA